MPKPLIVAAAPEVGGVEEGRVDNERPGSIVGCHLKAYLWPRRRTYLPFTARRMPSTFW